MSFIPGVVEHDWTVVRMGLDLAMPTPALMMTWTEIDIESHAILFSY